MAVLPYSSTSSIHVVAGRSIGNTNSNNTNTTATSTIQPSVKTILDLARECDQHVVRLYFLPTPGTNGFTTTHTLIRNDSHIHSASTHYNSTTTAITTASAASYHGSFARDQGEGTNGGDKTSSGGPMKQQRRRICHLTRVSESERGIVHLARLHITSMVRKQPHAVIIDL